MKGLLPLTNGNEEDALTRARRFYFWQRGEIRRLKRDHSKRERRYGQADARARAEQER